MSIKIEPFTGEVFNCKSADPKTWGEMTDAEKGALLLAKHHYGKVIQRLFYTNTKLGWWKDTRFENPRDGSVYRVKPEPKRETKSIWVTATGAASSLPVTNAVAMITFDTIDGVPDCRSVRMEEV
ncbi:MAG: hypothetical protein MRY81_10225 [Donghicola eburneus]|nr:hypothetical protein [Donghicola eburneus]MCI5040048.1 hypothetical protein [Donghicola eburneus]